MTNAERIAKGLQKARRSGSGFVACCPVHEDHEPSLSITDAGDKPLVKCHAGCDQAAVVDALKALGLWPEHEQRPETIEAIYDYTDEHGDLLYQIVRKPGKKFLQRYPDGAGGWIWKKHPRQVLYHLREVLGNPIVFVVEGERDVETLRSHGFVATCEAGGAKAPWLPQFTEALARPVLIEGEEFKREVILIPDNDKPGRQRVLRIARALKGKVARLVILTLEGHGVKDVSDWFKAHSEVELISMLDGEEVTR
jgi:DNA primase